MSNTQIQPNCVRELTLTLPLPPSTNNLYANRAGGRYPTAAYKKWQQTAAAIIIGSPRVITPCAITIEITRGKGWRRGCDVANREKAVIDALVKHNVIPDDGWEHVCIVTMKYQPDRPSQDDRAAVRVTITTIAHDTTTAAIKHH